eukprot:s3504_g2.t1
MPTSPSSSSAEEHRPNLRELVKQKIKELEFKVALELFASVARLVTKDEVARNPKAQAALDKEWENLRTKGVLDESRVRECRDIVAEAKKAGQTVHLGRIFEACYDCYEKGSELPESDPRRKFKGRTVFQGNNVRDENSDHALFNELGSSPASMEAAKLLDAFGSQPGFSKAQADADGPENFQKMAMASKSRPGPHRDKREAKKEARAAKFRGLEHAVKKQAGVMAKPVNMVRYDMSNFLESCVENYCKLAKVCPLSLKEVPTPFTDAGIARPTLSEEETLGKLQPIAGKVLMKIRQGWPGLISLELPSEHDSKSTSGSAIVLVGPNTYYPLNAFSKKQTVVAISRTEAEVVAANHSMRAEGIPMLALFEQLNLFKKLQGKPARDTAQPDADPVFTRIDPEIDEIRNGNVDTGCSVADINSLKASFPEFYQVKFMEDNQATITVMQSGSSASMRHMNKTQNINFKWLKQQFDCKQFDLLNVGTTYQVADILTKAFTKPHVWNHAISLIGIGPTKVKAARDSAKPSADKVPKLASAAGNQGGPKTGFCPRMLIEFCCSDDSKLCTPRKSNEDCHCIRVTEKEDGTKESCPQRLASQIKDFRNDFTDGTLILYASLPCVGGSPWGNINSLTVEGNEKIKEQQRLFTKLFKVLSNLSMKSQMKEL